MTTLDVLRRSIVLGVLFILSLSALPLFAQKDKKHKKPLTDETSLPNVPAVLWREPADIAARDLFLGPGGEEMRPDLTHVVSLRDDAKGHTTKYRVRDGSGNEWVAKLGNEAQPETAAS